MISCDPGLIVMNSDGSLRSVRLADFATSDSLFQMRGIRVGQGGQFAYSAKDKLFYVQKTGSNSAVVSILDESGKELALIGESSGGSRMNQLRLEHLMYLPKTRRLVTSGKKGRALVPCAMTP